MRSISNEARRSSPLLLAALVVASVVLMTAYFREGDDGPVHRTRTVMMTATTPAARAGHWITTPLRWAGDRVSGFGISRREVAELRRQNEELRKSNAELEEARLENERLRKLVGFAEEERFDSLLAHVIGRPTSSWEGAVTLDRGSDDGLAVGMPVVADRGLLGQIVSVSKGGSRVRLITDQRSGVAAMVQRTRAEGVVRGTIEGDLTLDFVDREAAPKPGDVVISSGMGGLYPKGLTVGEVVSVDLAPSDLYPRISVKPAVPIATIEEVLVLRGGTPAVEGADPE